MTSDREVLDVIFENYMAKRAALLNAGKSLSGWYAFVHPEDGSAMERAYLAMCLFNGEPVLPDVTWPTHAYGADWYLDDAVPRGTVRVMVAE